MPRLFLRLTLPVACLLVISVLAVRARPFQSVAEQVFPTTDCAMPCFMGIQPGVTMGADAIRILHENAWVDSESISIYEDTTRSFLWANWSWSKSSPAALRDTAYFIYAPQRDGIVKMMQIRTTIPVGDLKVMFGKPDEESLNQVGYVALYRREGFFVRHVTVCQFFWDQPADLIFVADTNYDGLRAEYSITRSRRPIANDFGELCH